MKKIETVQTKTGAVQIRVRWTSQEGDRGVYWQWSEIGTAWEASGEWSDPTGPFATKAEAREFAVDIVSSF